MNLKYIKNYELREKATRNLALILFNQMKLEVEIEGETLTISFEEVLHSLKVLIMREFPLRNIDELID